MRTEDKIIGFTVILGMFYWMVDSVLNYFFLFYEGSLLEMILLDVPINILYLRSLVFILFILTGTLFSRLMVRREHAEKIQSVLFKIAYAVNTTENLDELFNAIREYLGNVLDTTNFCIVLYDKNNDTFSIPYIVDENDELISFPQGKTLTSYVIRNNKSLLATEEVINELKESGEIEIIGTPAKVWAGVPLRISDEVIGALIIQSYTNPFLYSKEDLHTLKLISGQIAIAIKQKQAAEAVIASEEEKAIILDSLSELVCHYDKEFKIVWVNKATEESFGSKSDELIGKYCYEAWHNRDEHCEDCPGLRAIETGEFQQAEIANPDGRRWMIRANPVKDESGEVIGIVESALNITEQKLAEEAIRKSEEKYKFLYEDSPAVNIIIEVDGLVKDINTPSAERLGYTKDEIIGKNMLDLVVPKQREKVAKYLEDGYKGEHTSEIDVDIYGKNESIHTILFSSGQAVLHEGEEPTNILITGIDITEHKRLEEQLIQAQKMETVGRLAGGVAHDFNNLLTAITGYANFVGEELPPDDPKHEYIDQILMASDRASTLTDRLLAFSRRKPLKPQIINLNDLIIELDKMLRRLITEDIELITIPGEDLGSVMVDPGHIEQVIVNLVVNAKDAMPKGGELIIETDNVTIDEDFVREHIGSMSGEYVRLSVRDTGIGMTGEVIEHIFEPFFTTKEEGIGTGLGLSTVYGIVKQHKGYISVESTPGSGTIANIYLPLVEEKAEKITLKEVDETLPEGNETILVVEDEEMVRSFIIRVLERLGYTVIEASNGEEAKKLAREYEGEIHLLLTDLVMPKMSGKELASQLKNEQPNLKVFFVSGYSDDIIQQHGILFKGINFLQKPFNSKELAQKLRKILDVG